MTWIECIKKTHTQKIVCMEVLTNGEYTINYQNKDNRTLHVLSPSNLMGIYQRFGILHTWHGPCPFLLFLCHKTLGPWCGPQTQTSLRPRSMHWMLMEEGISQRWVYQDFRYSDWQTCSVGEACTTKIRLYLCTVGRTSIWYTADLAGFPTYKACRGL